MHYRNVQNYQRGRDMALKQMAGQIEAQEGPTSRRIGFRLSYLVSKEVLRDRKTLRKHLHSIVSLKINVWHLLTLREIFCLNRRTLPD